MKPLAAMSFCLLALTIFLVGISLTHAYTDQSTYFSCDNCSDCNAAIANTTYTSLQLSTDIDTNGSSTCIVVDVADYTLSCADYNINGTGGSGIGISVTTNATIANCVLRDLPQAIIVSGDRAIITNNTIINSTTEGIYADGAFMDINSNNFTDSTQGIDIRETGISLGDNDFANNIQHIYTSTSSSNATINNNRLVGNGTDLGIYARVSITGHSISNNTLYNHSIGIYSDSTTTVNNTIRENTLNYCGQGIWGDDGDLISNNTISNGTIGIILSGTKIRSTISNNTVSDGTTGISISGNYNNIITNTLTNNTNGLILTGTSNAVANNTITKSSTVGISLVNSITALIYNNFFNNTDNKDITGTGTNYWNTAVYNDDNILGYGIMGGNAWFIPGDGFSLTCEDDNKDGICDTGQLFDANNIDYYPLSLQGQAPIITAQYPADNAYNDSSDPATQTFNCSGEDNYTKLATLTLIIWNASGNVTESLPQSTGDVNNSNKSWAGVELANGTYTWNCRVVDQAGITAWGTNYTYKINYSDNETPNVSGQAPDDGYGNDRGLQVLQEFQCAAEDNYDLGNVSFYITDSDNTSFAFNQSQTLENTSDVATFSQMLNTGNYTWNCLAYDANGNSDWGDNYTLFINGSRDNVTNLNTGENFSSIQAAIDDANTLDGHVISIPTGEFYENINVSKALTLRGVGATTEIGADVMSDPVFIIESDNVTLDNMKLHRAITSQGIIASDVQRLRLTNLTLDNIDEGIILDNITRLTIHTVTFTNVNTSINVSTFATATLESITGRAKNRTAIHLKDGSALTMTSVSASVSNASAMRLQNITGGTLTSLVSSNSLNGLVLEDVADLTVSTFTTSGHGNSGLRIINSGSNSFGGVTATSNGDGIYIETSTFVTLSNSNSKNNVRGIVLNDSDGSIVTDNNISLNTGIGLLVLSTTNADIYDNYFGNNNNTYDTGTNEYYKSGSGTNIIGGSSIGGNYHGTENGTSCSKSASVNDTDGDRVADAGTCSITGGSSVDRSPLTYNYVEPVVNTTTTSSGGGGGGSYSAPPITKHTFVTIYNNVEVGDDILWSLTSSRPIVRQVSFNPKKAAERLELTIGQYDLNIIPDIAPEPLTDAVRYLKIDPIGLASKDAENVEFLMDLPSKKDLYIHDNGGWVPLKKTKEENFWRVESPHMSWFAIGPEGGAGTTPPPSDPVCGDGVVEGNELCDGSSLNGATCASRIAGTTGILSCTSACLYNTGACTTSAPTCTKSCGTDGTCNNLCAADSLCPTDPDCSLPPSCPYSCASDGRCVTGCESNSACNLDPDCSVEPNEEKASNMFGILIWVLLGLLVLGGGGAAVYFFVLQKDDTASMFPANRQHGNLGSPGDIGGASGTGGAGLPNTMLKGEGPNIIGGGGSGAFSTGAETIPDGVVSWAHKRLTEGYSPDDVKLALVKKGWTTTHAQEAVGKAEKFAHNIL